MDPCLLQWYVFFAIIFVIIFRIRTRYRTMKAGKIPDKWINCPPNGCLIMAKFMPFKTPLNEHFNHYLLLQNRFPPKALFDIAKQNGITFGLWIDLTNTDEFYFKDDIAYYRCRYVKISHKEYDEIPTKESTEMFIKLVHEFICRYPEDYIAVHCTYGFNRTGFFIVSFLVEKLRYELAKAIKTFAAARPPGIYDKRYICELYNRYGNAKDIPPTPQLPDWILDEKLRRPWRRLK